MRSLLFSENTKPHEKLMGCPNLLGIDSLVVKDFFFCFEFAE